ncbi:MAG TPA: choice-of-anchor L domain-containing protein [Verrucomicrobiae bacterium]|nr:choice-of-anchor L domain-containing protein [Verrucomicrobiae bacterium]
MNNRRGERVGTIIMVAALVFAGGPAAIRGGGFDLFAQGLTTNNLWLQIKGITNSSASLVIHRPWNDTNLTHDVFYASNLDTPGAWQFMQRCMNSNVVIGNLPATEGFFRLGQTNGVLTVNSNTTPTELAQMLLPPWITPSNVVYTGASAACGSFGGGNGCGLPLDTGVILATGDITNAIGPNNLSGATTAFGFAGDPDLDNLVGRGSTHDAAVLEFDVVSTNAMVLEFQYIFASEEYPEWIGPFNDPLAIFVSTNRTATNWTNTNNIALVPGTSLAVSVNTINGGCSLSSNGGQIPPTNPQYYVDNRDPVYSAMAPYGEPAPVFNIQYDGMTVLLTAQAQVAANVTNHVKIAIADYGDYLYDSAVFLKAWTPCP